MTVPPAAPLPEDRLAAAFDPVAAAGAVGVVDVDRDEAAGYRVEVRPLAGAAVPKRDELLPLLPSGSRWADAIGWSTIHGGPLTTSAGTLWTLGFVTIQRRAQGGAVPRARAYLHADAAGWAARIDELAATLDPAAADVRLDALATRVLVRELPGKRPDSSRAEQAWVLRAAAAARRAGARPSFRTVALSESDLVPLLAWPARLPPPANRAVVGVAAALERGYALGTQVRLAWRTFWHPY